MAMTEVLVATLMLGFGAVPETPAEPTERCGAKGRVEIRGAVLEGLTCVWGDGDWHGGDVDLTWTDVPKGMFRKFELAVQWQQKGVSRGVEMVDLTEIMDFNVRGTWNCGEKTKVTATEGDPRGGWRARGYITYDLRNDGKGSIRRNFPWTPVVS
jgi:hypothetical protein